MGPVLKPPNSALPVPRGQPSLTQSQVSYVLDQVSSKGFLGVVMCLWCIYKWIWGVIGITVLWMSNKWVKLGTSTNIWTKKAPMWEHICNIYLKVLQRHLWIFKACILINILIPDVSPYHSWYTKRNKLKSINRQGSISLLQLVSSWNKIM